MAIKERISYVIPIAFADDTSGTPVLLYEFENWSGKADIAFGVFFIGLRANKDYIVGIQVTKEDGSEELISLESNEFANKRHFRVSESYDGETIVSASLKVNFRRVTVSTPGIYEVQAVLLDPETSKILSTTSSFFDIKPVGMTRDEFR